MLWKAALEHLRGKYRKAKNGVGEVVIDEYPNHPDKSRDRPIQLVIGLDFGTSFSKVIVGETRVRYAVPFDGYAFGENALLLPSSLCVLPGIDKCVLGAEEKGGSVYDNLKMPLIERDFSDEVQLRAATFLALIFRHTRHWLLNAHSSIYEDREIEWFVNVGLPTDSYEDEKLTAAYLRIVRSAWHTSVMPGDVTLQAAGDSLARDNASEKEVREGLSGPLLPHDRINVFPEFAAQLAGYVRSPRRRDGLHVTVDVGGGTLDVTVFNIHQSGGEDVYPIFARKVAPLGVRYLSITRSRELDDVVGEALSPFVDLPSDADFRERFRITKDELRKADQPFRRRVEGVVAEPLRYTKQQRYPGAPQWRLGSSRYGEPLPSFFCGGGVLAEFYADLLHKFEGRRPPLRLRSSPLPIPDDLEAPRMTSRDYARLAVAYGLSFDPYDIGLIRRMDEVEDIHAESFNWTYEDRYIGKEQM